MRKCYLSLLISLIFLASPYNGRGQACKLLNDLNATIAKHHLLGPLPADTLLNRWQYLIGHELDPLQILFTQSDISQIRSGQVEVLQNQSAACAYFDQIKNLYARRLNERLAWLKQVEAQQLTYSKTDTFYLVPNRQAQFALDKEQLVARWLQAVKYQVLAEDQVADPDSLLRAMYEFKQCQHQKINPENAPAEKDFNERLLNCLAQAYDPHTQFFNDAGLNEFRKSLSASAKTFGFTLAGNADQGGVRVAALIPGGSAWKTNLIHEDDELLTWEAAGKTNTVAPCSEWFDILQEIEAGPDRQKFTFRRPSGEVFMVSLDKQELQVEENIIASYVLQKPEHKIGYVALPSFYSNWEGAGDAGCAEDVGRQILKLHREGIKGLILDLRFNGGGSLQEALNLVSLFIDEGPLMLVATSGGEVELIKDRNRGTVYDGPLAVLVNEYSASASEITAGILQEQKRAVVIGSTTFGKNIGQAVFPLAKHPNNYVSVTNLSLHWLSGQTLQNKGVKPDVTLALGAAMPGTYKERSLPFSFQPKKIIKEVTWAPQPELPVEVLAANSLSRLQSDSSFQVHSLAREQSAALIRRGFPIRLHPAVFSEDFSPIAILWEGDTQEESPALLQVSNHQFDAILYEVDEYRQLTNQLAKEELSRDPYVAESFNILLDLYQLLNP
jgi:carboxyl-terminal processing protease